MGLSEEGGFFTQAPALSLVPLALKAEYTFYFDAFALRPGLILGGMVLQAADRSGFSPFFGLRLYGEYALWRNGDANLISIFAGTGADFLLEQNKAYTLAQVELGVRVRPLNLMQFVKTGKAGQAEAQPIEAERIKAEQAEERRIEAERVRAEQAEARRIEAERVRAEQAEARRIEAERVKAEQAERAMAGQAEAERIEAE